MRPARAGTGARPTAFPGASDRISVTPSAAGPQPPGAAAAIQPEEAGVRCEVVAIGTELLLGQITDTNSTWIGEQLARIGIDSHYQVKVGDNFERIAACLRLALERSDAVICCGGLGPTQDDITREVVAGVAGVGLLRDPEVERRIVERFAARGRTMTENNRRQADIPDGATVIPQMPGTAPGFMCPVGDGAIYAVPGVPSEMRQMMEGYVLPDLRRRSGETAVIRSRTLRTWGHSESGLAEILAGRIEALDRAGNPTLAFLASGIEGLKVRITAKAPDEAGAQRIIAREEKRVRALLGETVFGVDDQTMEAVIVERLSAEGRTLAVAENLTGGLVSARLSAADPEMATFVGGWTRPWAAAGAAPAPPGPERARRMAGDVRTAHEADVGLAATGPLPGEQAAPGTVFMAIATARETAAHEFALPGGPPQVREYAVINLLNTLRRTLTGERPADRGGRERPGAS